jgi:hypothetical protein
LVRPIEFRKIQKIMGQRLAVKSPEEHDHLFADMAAPQDTHHPPGQLISHQLAPGPTPLLPVGLGEPMEQGNGHGDNHFGHGASVNPAVPT